jgi:hypothetical protein
MANSDDALLKVRAAVAALSGGDDVAAIVLLTQAQAHAILNRHNSTVVSARMPKQTARKFAALAAKHRVSVGGLARALLSRATTLNAGIVAEVTDALELPVDATLEQVLAAVKALYAETQPAEGSPLAGNAETPPPAALNRARASAPAKPLKPAELAYCQANAITPAEFQARKSTAVRRKQ